MRFCIIGNCQARGMARCFDIMVPGSSTVVFHLAKIYTEPDRTRVENWSSSISEFDAVFMLNHINDAKAGPFATDVIQGLCKKLIRYPYIAFTGLHPDCIYIRHDGVELRGPMGPYHSAMVAAAFLENLPPIRTARLFNSFAYSTLNYFNAYATSARSFIRSSVALGYSFSTFVDPQSRSVFMHTVNHPAIDIIVEMSRQALLKARITPVMPSTHSYDELGQSIIWPVYPDIANRIGVPGSLQFQAHTKNIMSLDQFVSRSYEAYTDGSRDFTTAEVEAARIFIRRYVVVSGRSAV